MARPFLRSAGSLAIALLATGGACKPDRPRLPVEGPVTTPPATGPVTTPPTAEAKTLATVVSQLGRGYRVKAPAGSEPYLGHRLVGGTEQPETNACFHGDTQPPAGGWDRIEVVYDTRAAGELRDVFGPLLRVPVPAGADTGSSPTMSLALDDIREHGLDSVYFTADGNCADDFESSEVNTYEVITRALEAGTLEISGDDALVSGTQVDVGRLNGAEVADSSTRKRRWEGTSLFFAVFAECLEVTARRTKCENEPVGPGNTCELGTCSFQVETLNPTTRTWTGTLTCSDGSATPFSEKLGGAPTKKVADGVSYNVQVLRGSGTGLVTIVLRRWSVGTVTGGCVH